MKPALILLIPVAFASCGEVQKTQTGQSAATSRYTSGATPHIKKNNMPDTVIITGSEYLKVLGRNENGMYPQLEGTWELASMPNANVAGNKNIINEVASIQNDEGKPYTGEMIMEAMKGSKEVKRETTTSKAKNGSTTTETTVYLVNNNEPGIRITPAQGDKFHHPERPFINLFGSNETFSGFTGCNRIAGRYAMSGKDGITFSHSAPSTRMVCIGDYDEAVFFQNLKRVNKYKSNGNELHLLDGDEVVFVFARK